MACPGDSNLCTQDICTEAFGGCYPPESVGTSCEGTFPCRAGETCDAAGACDAASGTEITVCANGDGCCPSGCCNSVLATCIDPGTYDNDCPDS